MTDKPEIEHKKITDFQPDNANANKGTERGLRMLDDSLSTVGAGRSIVVDKHGRIIGGNKTTERAIDNGFEDAIVVHTTGDKLVVVQRDDLDLYSNEPDNKARLMAYYDNRVGQLDLDWSAEQLLADNQLGVPLDKFFSGDELVDMGVASEVDIPEDEGAQIDRADELQAIWQVARGDVWVIPSITGSGVHRLLCGDSTNADDVATLLQDNRPRLMVTDPPYGVEYDQEWRSDNRIGKVQNDDRASWLDTWKLSPAEVAYVWHASRRATQVFSDLEDAGFIHRAQIIWNKPRHVFSQGHYHWKHEPCFYTVRKDATADWIGDRTQNTVWDIEADEDAPGNHSTQKPLECMERPIRNHEGDVYDPFGGSGTTMVAAERQKRTCYMIEIHPPYVACILERMSNLGCTPVKAD